MTFEEKIKEMHEMWAEGDEVHKDLDELLALHKKEKECAVEEFIDLYEKFCNSNIVCGSEECIGKFCPRCFKDNFLEQLKEKEE